jgi:predicted TPR repeat methyltransferase
MTGHADINGAGPLPFAAAASRSSIHARFIEAIGLTRDGRTGEAASLVHSILAEQPQHAGALATLGAIEAGTGRSAAALAWLNRSLAVRPGHAGTLLNRAIVLDQLGRDGDAEASIEHALAIDPECPKAWHAYAVLLHRKAVLHGDSASREAAAQAHRMAGSLGADPERTAFALASLGAAAVPDAAPRSYVEGLFDDYAPDFDWHLCHGLGYRTPELLVSALMRRRGTAQADIVDLGCGTGLCGPLLRPFARSLAGVDLSRCMVDLAGQRGCYDTLAQAEAIEYLKLRRASFDMVVAADVLPYIGDIRPLLDAALGALRGGGWLAVSVERHEGEGFTLNPTRRYSHGSSYVASALATAGFEVEAMVSATLRMNAGASAKGLLVVACRNAVEKFPPCPAAAPAGPPEEER